MFVMRRAKVLSVSLKVLLVQLISQLLVLSLALLGFP